MDALSAPVLVLNRSWQPMGTTPVRHAVTLVYAEAARFVDPTTFMLHDFASWRGLASRSGLEARWVRGCNWQMPLPELIVLAHFDGQARREIRMGRRALLARDQQTCQYCGERQKHSELTLDHVIPRSRGGRSTWENLVAACQTCNLNKANRTPEEAGMKLLRRPHRPRDEEAQRLMLPNTIPASWRLFLKEGVLEGEAT